MKLTKGEAKLILKLLKMESERLETIVYHSTNTANVLEAKNKLQVILNFVYKVKKCSE